MLIQYVCTKNYVGLLDFLRDKDPAKYIIHKQEGSYLLKEWAVAAGRMSFVTEIVLDRDAFREDDVAFSDGIKSLKVISKARVSVLMPGKGDSVLAAMLTDAGVGNIAASADLGQLRGEIEECLSPDGMALRGVKSAASAYRFKTDIISVALYGSRPKIGVTNTALALAKWVTLKGAKAYAVTKDSPLLRSYFTDTEGGGAWLWEDVTISDFPPKEEDINPTRKGDTAFVIYDGGIGGVDSVDISAVILGWKPTEYGYTKQAVGKAPFWLVNFAPNNRQINEEISETARELSNPPEKEIRYQILGWCPDPADPEGHSKAFLRLLADWII